MTFIRIKTAKASDKDYYPVALFATGKDGTVARYDRSNLHRVDDAAERCKASDAMDLWVRPNVERKKALLEIGNSVGSWIKLGLGGAALWYLAFMLALGVRMGWSG